MTYVKGLALTLLISAMAGTAHAGESWLFPFHCGLQLGGSATFQKSYSEPTRKRVSAKNRAVKSIVASGPGVAAFTGAKPNNIGRRRMPPTFTLAKIGCS